MTDTPLAFSDIIRINEIGAGLKRRLEPDAATRARIAKTLDLAALDLFHTEMALVPAREGWRLNGRVVAEVVQTCGITLEPLPASIDRTFTVDLVEAVEQQEDEVDVAVDDNAPDIVEDGRIDLGQYAVEQLALNLDPFPRKPGAQFVQPDEPEEISPFSVLKAFKSPEGSDKG